ncbi:MAG: hypothetical protein U0528_13115 [Anaerolineae bacterium]
MVARQIRHHPVRPIFTTAYVSLIIIQEGPLAFVRQLGRWIKGERGYYRRFEQVSPVREPVPEPDTSHLQWTAEQPELSDSIAGIVTIRRDHSLRRRA